ncbi:MAG: hypothetical protein K8S99_05290 [Planctomycetes bacterium]|nr:hypothetical protein [Planctomycetota bacterium]
MAKSAKSVSNIDIEIVPIIPFDDGVAEGKKIGAAGVKKQTAAALKSVELRDTLGAMSRRALEAYVASRLETPPDYARYPELADIYPERVDRLHGVARGAGCTLLEAAVMEYVKYKAMITRWDRNYNPPIGVDVPRPQDQGCSGALMVGPDGVLASHSADSLPLSPMPRGYRWRKPGPWKRPRQKWSTPARPYKLFKPRTGYIEQWGAGNEKGVGCFAGVSCWCWLDEPIEDTWPICNFPILRFASNIGQVVELYTRYTLFNWSGASQVWADVSGDGVIAEKSFRRVAFRRMDKSGVLWCTEGHFQTEEMGAYIRHKRLAYLERVGKHLGAGDMQYYTDSAVRFTHMGEICHMPWGRGYDHMRKLLSDHATFPRAVCRHGGPDTDPYDQTVTMAQSWSDLTNNRTFGRGWVPWKS